MKMNIKSLLKSGVAISVLLLGAEAFGSATITIPGNLVSDTQAVVAADVSSVAGRRMYYAVDNAITNPYAFTVGENAVLELVAVYDGHHDSKLTQDGVITLSNGSTLRLAGNAGDESTNPSIKINPGKLVASGITGAKLDIAARGVVLPNLASFTGLDVEVSGSTAVNFDSSGGKIGGALSVASGVTATLKTNISEITGGLKGAGGIALSGNMTIKGATSTFTGTLAIGIFEVTLEYPFKEGNVSIDNSGSTTTAGLTTTKAGTIKKVTSLDSGARMRPQDHLTITTLDLIRGNCTFATLAGKKVTISAIANQGLNFPIFSSGTFEIKDTVTVGSIPWTIGGGKGSVKKVVLTDATNAIISSIGDLTIEELDIQNGGVTVTAFKLNPASGKTITVKKITGDSNSVAFSNTAVGGTVILPTSWAGTVADNDGILKIK